MHTQLLDGLEAVSRSEPAEILSCNDLAERVASAADFRAIAEALTNDPGFDLLALVKDLVLSDAVPNLAGARYTETGLIKRREWEKTWELQRAEDRGEAVDPIPVPPKYATKDFQKSTYWSLRGKLDVPKERFVLVVGAERESDPTPHILWAGHDQRAQAKALAALYQRRLAEESWPPARLAPVLAAIDALIPWIRQWHDTPDPATNRLASETYDSFVAKQCLSQGLDRSALASWAPAAKGRRGRSTTE